MYFDVFTSSKESSGCWCMWRRHACMVYSCDSNFLTIAFIGIPPVAASRPLRFRSTALRNGEHDRYDSRDDHDQVEAQCNQSHLANRHVVLSSGKSNH